MTISKLTKYSTLLSIVPAIYYSFFPGKIVLITILCCYPLLILLFSLLLKGKIKKVEDDYYIKIFILYNFFLLIRGFVDAKSYQDWTTLYSGGIATTLFIPFTIYFGTTINSLITLLRTFFWYGLILCGILFFIVDPADGGPFGFAHMISPIYLFILLLPYLTKKYRLFLLFVIFISFTYDIANRSNLLNIIIAILISLTYLWKNSSRMLNLVKFLRFTIIWAPILFLILGLTNIFNIFTIGDSFKDLTIEDSSGKSQEVFIDSRTGIYVDVFGQLKEEDAFLFGLGTLGATKTSLTDVSYADFDVIYKEGRRSTESGMLNFIQYGGLFGGLLYFILFFRASYLGVYKSNNWLSVMMGLWIAFKGLYSFIEDINVFALSSIFLFASIGVCMNKELRRMNDVEIKNMLRRFVFTKDVLKNK